MGVFWLRLVERLFWEESEWCVMVMSPVMLGMVPEWALVGALWAAVGVFVMSAFTAWRRMMAVPGVAEGRADSVRVRRVWWRVRPCVGCSGCGGWRVYVAALLPCKSVLPVAALPLCPLVWVGVARFLAVACVARLLVWRWVSCAFGSCSSVGRVWRLWSGVVEGRCLVVAGFHVGVRGKAAGRVVRCSAKAGTCKLMGADGAPTPHLVRWRRARRFSLSVMLRRVAGLLSAPSVGLRRTREYPAARELSARQMRALTAPMRGALRRIRRAPHWM